MKHIALALSVFALVASAFFAMPPHVKAEVSPALQSVLSEIRGLSDNEFRKLYRWANSDPLFPPVAAPSQPDQTEEDILALEKQDKRAVLGWLQGKGRTALYARGATDEQIGPKYRLISPVPSATPNAWRGLPLAPPTPKERVQGNMQILGGFAAVRQDGTAAIACVSFKNTAHIVAARVIVDIPLLTTNGQTLASLTLDRHGQFSPNVPVAGYGTLSDWQTRAPGSRSENCTEQQLTAPALAILQARLAGYRVMRVEYVDGSVWPRGAPPASPVP